jgi:phage gp16-like protein
MSIKIKPSHEGVLHRNMGVKAGRKISTSALDKAEKTASPAEKKRIVFAKNARKWNHNKAGSGNRFGS